MWQEIAIVIIAVGLVIYIGWKVYCMLTKPKAPPGCSGCSGCNLKDRIQAKKACAGNAIQV